MPETIPPAAPTPTSIKVELGSEFPDWRIIHSTRDRWWALRGPLPRDRMGEVDCVDADTADDLRAQLRELAS